MTAPLLLLSDVHISRAYGAQTCSDLARLISAHSACELILVGDIFDLTLDHARVSIEDSLASVLSAHEELRVALSTHAKKGGRIQFVPGNHDGTLGSPGAVQALRRILQADNDTTIQIHPWFVRRARIHIEHGHLYDPDCAPNHPLADPNPEHEGLGNALMRRFVAPHEAYLFAHKNQTTLTSGVSAAIQKWGARAPWVIARYFATAGQLWAEATLKKDTVEIERRTGEQRLLNYAESQNVHLPALRDLIRSMPSPTHHRGRDVFLRLYFDRVLAVLSLLGGAGLLSTVGLGAALGTMPLWGPTGALTGAGALLSALGTGYLVANVSKKSNRYGDAVIGQLAQGADLVRSTTDAKLVIFGHSHVEVAETNYINLGSFGYGRRGRPYLLVDTQGSAQKHWL